MADMSGEVAGLRRWIEEPVTFVRQVIGIEPYPWQAKVLQELPKLQRVALCGSKGCAKTALESWVIWWSLTTQYQCKAAATSINGTQLRDGLWAELALWQKPLLKELFHWSPERIVRKTEPGKWFASARTFNRDADPNTQGQALAGIHGPRCLFVLDEAGGVPPALLATADAVLATWQPGYQQRVLIGGNTTSTKGALYAACGKQRNLWKIVRITSDPDDPDRTPAVSAKWAREQIETHGRENPWVKINVFAEFPTEAIGKLLSLSDMEQSLARNVEEDRRQPLVIGGDVGTVTDAAVLYPRRGRLLMPPRVLRGKSTVVIAAEIVNMARELGATAVFIDAGGPGIGVIDQCRLLGLAVVPVYFGGAADDPNRYANKRVEMYTRAAEWVREGGKVDASPELVQDMTEPEVSWNLKGQQILEPKDDVKERLSRSPDWGDGFALTFAYPVAAPPAPEDTHQHDAHGHRIIARALRDRREQSGYDEFGFGG